MTTSSSSWPCALIREEKCEMLNPQCSMKGRAKYRLTGQAPLSRLLASVPMVWFGRKKERERFYLLPGMGGRNLMRKRKVIMRWTLVAGLLTSAILAWFLFWASQRH